MPSRQRLLEGGLRGPHLDEFRERVQDLLRAEVVPLLEPAERDGRFPREAIERLAATGLFRERWEDGGDAGRAAILAEELGRAGLGGVGVGISVHLEAVLSILRRFGTSDGARERTERALDGIEIGCLASSEAGNGSNLLGVESSVVYTPGGGLRVRGEKRFASLGGTADFALILAHVDDSAYDGGPAPLTVVLIPAEGFSVSKRHVPLGMRSLETVALSIDAELDEDALVGRPGGGLLVASWGLMHERLAGAAQTIGMCSRALTLATTHLHRRTQFGVPLFEHQALRLRLADLHAQVSLARSGLYAFASMLDEPRASDVRESAGMKASIARLGERVISECVHVFGGTGYLEDELPVARMWRDIRFARLGGGTDEMMWELVAGALPTDEAAYDEMWSDSP